MIISDSFQRDHMLREKFMVHSTESPLIRLYARMDRERLLSLPICPKCERLGLRDKGWIAQKIMTCPHCGYHGKATHQMSAYLNEGCYK
jgi:ribosomal protein L37AE/L43A